MDEAVISVCHDCGRYPSMISTTTLACVGTVKRTKHCARVKARRKARAA